MNRLVKKNQVFCERMHEEFVFIFKRCSKDLVTDLGNENMSENIEASGKRLALGCTLQWNTKCVLRYKLFLACRSSVWQMTQELVFIIQAEQEQRGGWSNYKTHNSEVNWSFILGLVLFEGHTSLHINYENMYMKWNSRERTWKHKYNTKIHPS